MALALQYSWLIPVMIGVAGAYYFLMQDLGAALDDKRLTAKTED